MTSPQDYRYISDALSNGAKLISVNPCFEPLSAKADTYVPVRPGTDAALAMSMIRYIEENGLADEAYLKTMTVAPFLVKASDGKFLRLSDIEPDTPQESDTILAWDSASESATSAYVAADPALRGSFTVGDLECHPAYQLLIDRVEPFTTEKAARICGP